MADFAIPPFSFVPGAELLSSTVVLDDVFWGLYHWLDNNPTETILVSIKVDSGPTSVNLQNAVRALWAGSPGDAYWFQDPQVAATFSPITIPD
jgi:hypothetical protein